MWQYEGFEQVEHISESWLYEWYSAGLFELRDYLRKWQAFADYLEVEATSLVRNA